MCLAFGEKKAVRVLTSCCAPDIVSSDLIASEAIKRIDMLSSLF